MTNETEQSAEAPRKGWEPGVVESKWYPLWQERGYFSPDPKSTKPA